MPLMVEEPNLPEMWWYETISLYGRPVPRFELNMDVTHHPLN